MIRTYSRGEFSTWRLTIEAQQKYWTEQCAHKRFTTPFMMDVFARHVAKDAHILDFGCGYGRTLAELEQAGFTRLTGIDFSEPLVERGRAEHPALDLATYPGGPLPYADSGFDVALMLGVFTCMLETKLQAETLLEIKRILKPGGHLYVADFLLNRDKRNLDRYAAGQEKYALYGIFETEDGGVLRHHNRNHMEALFFDFETIAFEEMVFETMHGNQSEGFWTLLRMP